MPGRLILCATPIGNLGDAPPRLTEALSGVDLIYVEDTRRARVLLDHLGVQAPVRSYFVGNEAQRSQELVERLKSGETIALLTDAGTPGVADPGVSAVRAAVAAGADVTGIPGPSAVTLALALSGASADRFVFEGFLPRSGRGREERIDSIAGEERTVVLFSAPSRLVADLADLAKRVADRECVVTRELTKMHEEVWRGTVAAAVEHWGTGKIRGEITLVVFGGAPVQPDLTDAIGQATSLIERGERPSEAVRQVAGATGVSRKALYAAVIEASE